MKNSLQSSFQKFLSLTLVLLAVIIFIKSRTHTDPKDNLARYVKAEENTPKIFFVGSSRFRSGISVDQLKKLDSTETFYNLGHARASILFSCRMAEKLIDIVPARSLIYIELSDILIIPPYQAEYFYSLDDLLQILKRHFRMRFSIADIDKMLLQFFNIRADIGNFKYDEKLALAKLEYQIEESPFYGNASSIITQDDIQNASAELSDFQKDYLKMINELIEKGGKKRITVKFVLPVTIEKASERAQTLSIYNHIPAVAKLVYSKGFLQKIQNTAYLGDANHLNAKGAYLNTLEIYGDIEAIRRK